MTESVAKPRTTWKQLEEAAGVSIKRGEIAYKRLESYNAAYKDRLQYTLWKVALATPALLALNSNVKTFVTCSALSVTSAIRLLRAADISLVCSIIVAILVYAAIDKNQQRLESIRLTGMSDDDLILQSLIEGGMTERIKKELNDNSIKMAAFKTKPSSQSWRKAARLQLGLVIIGYLLTGILLTSVIPTNCP